MPAWKKSFRKLPPFVQGALEALEGTDVKVLSGKIVKSSEVSDGLYASIGLTEESLFQGSEWETIPSPNAGKSSKRNVEGWVEVRKDLPKYTKYFYHDIQNFGDGSRYGWSTVAIPREVYERDEYPPYLFHVVVSVQEEIRPGEFTVVFSIDEVFSKDSSSFHDDSFFALNLLQEVTGTCGVVRAENPRFVFTSEIDWELFPPGNIDEVAEAVAAGRSNIPIDTVKERLELFEKFEPKEYLRGLGGNDYYIGAKYADDLVAFENLKYGNALYVLYAEWQELSQRPRSELLKLPSSKLDRIVHTVGWEGRFAVLMQRELKERGVRIRIGRNMRRRRR